MSIRFLSDNIGEMTDVVIPINEWRALTQKYPEMEAMLNDIPDWQKKLIDKRLTIIQKNSETIRPVEELFAELDN